MLNILSYFTLEEFLNHIGITRDSTDRNGWNYYLIHDEDLNEKLTNLLDKGASFH